MAMAVMSSWNVRATSRAEPLLRDDLGHFKARADFGRAHRGEDWRNWVDVDEKGEMALERSHDELVVLRPHLVTDDRPEPVDAPLAVDDEFDLVAARIQLQRRREALVAIGGHHHAFRPAVEGAMELRIGFLQDGQEPAPTKDSSERHKRAPSW